jgi:hypothetical protein
MSSTETPRIDDEAYEAMAALWTDHMLSHGNCQPLAKEDADEAPEAA